MPSPKRPEVLSVVITARMPDGKIKVYAVDPTEIEAVFWTKKAAKDILGGFYKGQGKKLDKAQAEKNFGKTLADTVFGTKQDRTLDETLIEEIWDAPKDGDTAVAFLGKTIGCLPTNG